MNAKDLADRIRILVEPILIRLGYDLVAVEWAGEGRGAILRLSIDFPAEVPRTIGADDCARVSSHVSQILDEHDPIASSYHLEVSSPGMERPLQRVADFARFTGYRAQVRLAPGLPRRRATGVLAGVEGEEIRLLVDGKELRFRLDDIERAHLKLDFEEYQKLAEGRQDPAPANDDDAELDHDQQ